jgi:hypothetical protein
MQSLAVVLALAGAAAAWWLATRKNGSSSANVLDPKDLFVTTATESNERVRRVFPNGVASEDAGSEVGTAAPPPDDDVPDGTQSFVSEIVPPTPVSARQVRDALPALDASRIERWVKGLAGAGRWLDVHDGDADAATFSRIAVIVDLVELHKPVDVPHLERETQWARALASKLGAPAPSFSMTPQQAAAKAMDATAARAKFSDDDVDIGVVIAAPKAKRFPGRQVWDAVYSVGFTWGDGDYFHWVPSDKTDVSQGISIGTSTGATYFLPESLLATDGSADVEVLELSFNAARCWQPTQVFDVMSRAATYLARRLGGAVTTKAGTAFDPHRERSKVVAFEKELLHYGVTPGSGLALSVF